MVEQQSHTLKDPRSVLGGPTNGAQAQLEVQRFCKASVRDSSSRCSTEGEGRRFEPCSGASALIAQLDRASPVIDR